MTQRHKYADILIAVAEGQDIEILPLASLEETWATATHTEALSNILYSFPVNHLRIKPKTIRIGEYDVPAPMRVAPKVGSTYYLCNPVYSPVRPAVESDIWTGLPAEIVWLENGFLQVTEEGAEKQLKALLSLTQNKQ